MRTIGSVDLLTLLSFLYGDTRCDFMSIHFVNRLRQYWLIQNLRQFGMHTIGHCLLSTITRKEPFRVLGSQEYPQRQFYHESRPIR